MIPFLLYKDNYLYYTKFFLLVKALYRIKSKKNLFLFDKAIAGVL